MRLRWKNAPAVREIYYPDGYFAVRMDKVILSSDVPLKGEKPGDGKQWAIATFTAKNIGLKQYTLFDLGGEKTVLRDMDNEKYEASSDKWKASRDEDGHNTYLEPGEEMTFRLFFEIPKTPNRNLCFTRAASTDTTTFLI